ncbi:phosphoglycerate dehydrogenase [Staphylococcus shinii]|uniref:phosphoglycerate dehydrogenase n=1 Tax=Staphylococcus TaxID=1279 RepID=UPI000D1F0DB1|nr:phosphoglycerate dehydrogenase [Staphylococcus shinii]MBO3066380.1 phosphoglycerate dehydrogenase [Staphylococcus shinii]MEC5302239.1 phosphoglycerate dehydrogenase [Staphylococcus shinii]PTH94394.1 hydroxyacid dehydrogenase [Staphylococcus shinii]RIM98577.1 hydroxyacid dehydrogenase [Staphylococcus shinii]
MKAVSLMKLGDLETELIERFPTVEFVFTTGVSNIDKEDKQTLDILFGYDSNLDTTFLSDCPNLKWLAWYSTGVNKLPLKYISDNNIKLTNGKGVHAKQMSEFIFAYILDDYKKMRTSYINQIKKHYNSKMSGKRLSGQRLLFLGTGSIAQNTAKIANTMNMEVFGINTTGHDVNGFSETYAIEDLKEVISKADIIVNTLPETNETIHLLTKYHFELMKNELLFINVGRGSIVKEEVLVEVLKEKIIRHAYLDVFENEPLTADNPLYELENVTITAHITGNGAENKAEVTEIFSKNLESILNNDDLIENVVDPKNGY